MTERTCDGPGCTNPVAARQNTRDNRPVFCGRVCASNHRTRNRDRNPKPWDKKAMLDMR